MSESAVLQELKLLKERVDRIEKMLEVIIERFLPEEEMGEEDYEALREALEEYRKGETIPLNRTLRLREKRAGL
ncbi:MAG: hypothetical protein DRJ51_08850 [Thermoprotei archaeon]|nr:MAG: hypothetical protein DRJ51_08850 [Thermoprotei archaeon]RLF02018.1 MAG: hypothetical protein DRJ59_04735 [Thermoprotei archaeon]